jgi:hypothetical protein
VSLLFCKTIAFNGIKEWKYYKKIEEKREIDTDGDR